MGKKAAAAKPAAAKPRPTPTEAILKEEQGKVEPDDGSIKFIAREVKNIYTSEDCLLDKDNKVSEAAMAVVVELCKNANIFVFVVKTARQRGDSHALKPEIRESARSELEKYIHAKKLPIRIVPVPAEASPVTMKVRYLGNVIETATFPIWVVEKKGPTADKDVILTLKKSANWSLVQNDPGATSKDGTIVKTFGIDSADDWSKKIVPADKEDVREVVAEKEKAENESKES